MLLESQKHIQNFLTIISLLASVFIYGQISQDSVRKLTRDQLSGIFWDIDHDSLKASVYAYELLRRGKESRDTTKMADGYFWLSRISKDQVFLDYSDTIIQLTKNKPSFFHPMIAYFFKGDYYYDRGKYQIALDNYLLAIENTIERNKVYEHALKASIASVKTRLGEDEEALSLFKEAHDFYYPLSVKDSSWNENYYFPALQSLADSYRRNGMIDSASYANAKGYQLCLKMKDTAWIHYFRFQQGVVEFEKENYRASIDSIGRSMDLMKRKDLYKLAHGYFYLGESYLGLNETSTAIEFYNKVDSLCTSHDGIIDPTLRKGYLELVNYYKDQNDLEKQLEYVDKLLKVDSILSADYKVVKNKLFKSYDTPILLREKEDIIEKIRKDQERSQLMIFLMGSLFVLMTAGFVFQYRRRYTYKRRFKELMDSNKPVSIANTGSQPIRKKEINVPEEIVAEILENLTRFEAKHEFTSSELTLNLLAKNVQTNASYLSKVINHYKKLSFSRYLNSLRVDYAIDQLKHNKTFRKYTVKAISHEVGFKTAESFAKAFHKKTGLKPSYFIRELEKTEELQSSVA